VLRDRGSGEIGGKENGGNDAWSTSDLIAERHPMGFAKDVNDYFNHYITLADAKAAGFIAATLTVGAAALKLHPTTMPDEVLRWLAVVVLGAALAAGSHVVFPRLPSGRRGLVFWEDVRTFKDHEEYQREVANLTADAVEVEYAAQNYFVADVVHRKHYWVRWEIVLFLVGTVLAVGAYCLA
jgi:hypothetical protein